MWTDTELEKQMKRMLKKEQSNYSGSEEYESLISNYNLSKEKLCKHVYPYIEKNEPHLTDHSEIHIQNVLQNINRLIDLKQFNAIELYILCMATLFHDVGNYFDRAEHDEIISWILNEENFSFIRKDIRNLIILVAKTHRGDINKINNIRTHVLGVHLQINEICSVLRFADECAEGPQRLTHNIFSKFEGVIAEESKKYHDYASITNLFLDKERVAIEFQFHLDDYASILEFKDILELVFKRILKLNEERINCAHYSRFISQIKKIDISMIFYKNDDPSDEIEVLKEYTNFSISNIDLLVGSHDCIESTLKIDSILSTLKRDMSW